ncbi:hypothetical protein VFPFJ_09002 [Purpureocillium lilacinum]|uniref:Uncharacterized protein n=1 Tax=Purpureocillium lilacinum TaxID=33203 RepID=A0A179H1D5_PURLI|nr:hypothetical protein VFPFJ_09002 [Purpureocillium lilacinum]OAQ76048.1 hypothetical protein VFPBJ_08408 [Purpureocillium lilacinum]OAQ83199.1 hypothetical protein VFPFJ_09002 [Purpureocillium lilacinum]
MHVRRAPCARARSRRAVVDPARAMGRGEFHRREDHVSCAEARIRAKRRKEKKQGSALLKQSREFFASGVPALGRKKRFEGHLKRRQELRQTTWSLLPRCW